MSNALNRMPVAPVARAVAGGSETPGGQPAPAGHFHGRVSADSFKQLTAKLKRVSREAIADVAGDIAALAPEPAPEPAIAPGTATAAAEPPKVAAPAADEASGPEAESAAQIVSPPTDPEPTIRSEPVRPAPAFNGIPQLELPEFRPISWFDALPVSAVEVVATIEESALADSSVDTPDDAEPVVAGSAELPADLEPVAMDSAEFAADLEPVAMHSAESAVDPEPIATDSAELPADLEPVAMDSVESAADAEPAVEPDTGSPADPVPAPLDIPAEPLEAQVESESPAETVPPAAAAAAAAEVSQAIGIAATEPPADDRQQPDLADELAAPRIPEIAEEPAAGLDDSVSAEIRAEAVEEVHEAFAIPERVPPASPLAERVVGAMLKTISTAIYAKPSASERAAFIRDMAELAKVQGEAGATPAQAVQPRPASTAIVLPPILPAPAPPAPAPPAEPEKAEDVERPIADALASRMGPAASVLRAKPDEDDDPFAQPAKLALLDEPKLTETEDADEATGELALTLLDMMSGGAGTTLPHERALASDTLLRILPRIPVKQLQAVVERVAIMETPPALLVAKLIRDPRPEVLGPLLERCSHISDQDLMNAAPSGDPAKLRMMARRRILSTVLSDYLIEIGEPNVLLTLIRNPGAAFSHSAFYRLAEHASNHHALLPPLVTRADLPAPVAFELFWHVPQELRRFILSRFLTDSETLSKILRITLSTHNGESDLQAGDVKFPPKDLIDKALETAAAFKLEEAAHQLSEIGAIGKDTALRILSDREGEPLAVLLKAMGYPRGKLEDMIAKLCHPDAGLLRADRNPEELPAIFDGLSFNKARILLTYWDWFIRKAGPYAPHN